MQGATVYGKDTMSLESTFSASTVTGGGGNDEDPGAFTSYVGIDTRIAGPLISAMIAAEDTLWSKLSLSQQRMLQKQPSPFVTIDQRTETGFRIF
jgi:hypothetical protein